MNAIVAGDTEALHRAGLLFAPAGVAAAVTVIATDSGTASTFAELPGAFAILSAGVPKITALGAIAPAAIDARLVSVSNAVGAGGTDPAAATALSRVGWVEIKARLITIELAIVTEWATGAASTTALEAGGGVFTQL